MPLQKYEKMQKCQWCYKWCYKWCYILRKKVSILGGGQIGVNTPYLRGLGSLSGGGYFGQNSIVFQLFHYNTLQDRHLYIIKKATVKVASGRSIKLPIRFGSDYHPYKIVGPINPNRKYRIMIVVQNIAILLIDFILSLIASSCLRIFSSLLLFSSIILNFEFSES